MHNPLFSVLIFSMGFSAQARIPILSDLKILEAAQIPVQQKDTELGLGLAQASDAQIKRLSRQAHDAGRCGGFEALPNELNGQSAAALFDQLRHEQNWNRHYQHTPHRLEIEKKAAIETAVHQVDAEKLRDTITWYSSFETRFNKNREKGMIAVQALKQRLESVVGTRARVEFVDHVSTPQKSIRVTFPGVQAPEEIVILGAHLDSVNWEDGTLAPGADDNGSGTANILEVARILTALPPSRRTVEINFYAGEESGLLGSAEIARAYKEQLKNVIGVLQLDMTLHPGSGEGVVNFISDYTNAWLNDYLKELNRLYVGAKVLDDACGYACSDHASWHRQGFAAVFPFESGVRDDNREIHTSRDVINARSSFTHSALFSKLGVAFALDLANSTLHRPE